jgi:hypothetical protein
MEKPGRADRRGVDVLILKERQRVRKAESQSYGVAAKTLTLCLSDSLTL